MKKSVQIVVVVLLALSARVVSAQVKYGKGDAIVNLGVGAGYSAAPSFAANAEFFIDDAISIGPYLGIGGEKYNYGWGHVNYTYFNLGGRASYHFSKWLNLRTNKLDLYGGGVLGYAFVNSAVHDNSGYVSNYNANGSQATVSVVAGGRWYFSQKFGVNAEFGTGYGSPVTAIAGITLKL
jgi:hypothetical protein